MQHGVQQIRVEVVVSSQKTKVSTLGKMRFAITPLSGIWQEVWHYQREYFFFRSIFVHIIEVYKTTNTTSRLHSQKQKHLTKQ